MPKTLTFAVLTLYTFTLPLAVPTRTFGKGSSEFYNKRCDLLFELLYLTLHFYISKTQSKILSRTKYIKAK